MKRATVALAASSVLLLSGCAVGISNVDREYRILGPNLQPCTSDADCRTDVVIRDGDLDDEGHVVPGNGCHVEWGYRGYEVAAKKKNIWLRWNLVDKTSSPWNRYTFDTFGGITLNPDDRNDTAQDLTDGQIEGSKGFKWRSINGRKREGDPITHPGTGEIRFDFFVIRRHDDHRCRSKDPVIINKGD